MRRRKPKYEYFKVVYRNERGQARVTIVGYSEDGANNQADKMEDEGVEIIDVIEVKPGTPHEDIERMYE
jgi:hypothetical protein